MEASETICDQQKASSSINNEHEEMNQNDPATKRLKTMNGDNQEREENQDEEAKAKNNAESNEIDLDLYADVETEASEFGTINTHHNVKKLKTSSSSDLGGNLDHEIQSDDQDHEFHEKNNNNNYYDNDPVNNNMLNTGDEVDVNIHEDGILVSAVDDTGIYDDVMAAPTPNMSNEYANELITSANDATSLANNKASRENENNKPLSHGLSTNSNSNAANFSSNSSNTNTFTRRVSCYVGNLTWWTSDKDLSEAVSQLGVTDLIEIKFYENKVNGQSKGFALVTVGSDQTFRTIMEKLPKIQINGQRPIVTHFTRHFFNQFEEQARKDMPSTNSNNGMHNTGPGLMDHHSILHSSGPSHPQNPLGNSGNGLISQHQQIMSMFVFFFLLLKSFVYLKFYFNWFLVNNFYLNSNRLYFCV
jgi:RNA recognition motif-containing protein